MYPVLLLAQSTIIMLGALLMVRSRLRAAWTAVQLRRAASAKHSAQLRKDLVNGRGGARQQPQAHLFGVEV